MPSPRPRSSFIFSRFLLTSFLLFLLFVVAINAFNVDTKRPQIHRRLNTGFGYAVDFVYKTPKRDKFTLLVGAPFAQTSQRGLRNAGAVYGCETDQNTCAEIFFDRQQGNELRLNGSALLPIEEKSNQMFGATVVASKNGDSVLACAPHYKYFFAKFEVVEPVGTCFYAQDYFTKIQEFAPCRQEPARHGHHRFGYGMCGFSAAVPGNGDKRLFISGPGVWYWQGAVFSQNVNNITDRPNTADGPAHTDHHQLGYATTAGDFNGDGVDDIVVGVPRGNQLIGMVSIYTESLRPIINLTDSNGQRGQYFGASLAVADLNKDGLADLIVGSPFYTDYKSVFDAKTQERKPQYDLGKVYIYIQASAGTFKDPIQLVGHGQWGRFGYAVASAGDLNGDGFEDILIGAPFDGEDGRGSVYVYHGSEDGIRTQYTQRIQASDIHRDLRTFGFSLKAGRDIDKNDYPDVAIGAVQSSQAVVLRTRPVIQISGNIRTTRKTINLDEKLCVTEFGRMPCEKLKFCLKYSGKLQQEYNNADVKLKLQLDSKKSLTPRAFFSRKDLDKKRGVRVDPASISREQPDKIEHTITLNKGREHCETYDVYVPDTIRDKISPIIIAINYTYVERGSTPGGGLEPAADNTLPQNFETELTIEKDCGDDNVCVPDLQIHASKPTQNFTLGTEQTLTLNVSVRNQGEDSYLTQYYVTIPPGFEYGGIETYETKHKVSCSPYEGNPKNKDEPYVYVCEIGNPLPANAKADFGFKITGSEVDPTKEYIEVKMAVNSTNEEETGRTTDNEYTMRIPVEFKAQLYLAGRSNPEQVDYSVRNRTPGDAAGFDFEIGPVVSHLYQVRNNGPSAISGATLDIFWPSFSENGKHLLYLIDMPYINDPSKASCRINQGYNVNPASLAISGEHISAPHGEIEAEPTGEEREEIRVESDEDEEDEDDSYRRKRQVTKKRQVQTDAVRRSMRRQKQELKQAVDDAKAAGTAIEYHGTLGRSTVDCHSINCTHISCDISRLEEDEYVLVEIYSRLWVNTLIDDNIAGADISSLAIAQITSMPNAPKFTPPAQLVAVTTDVNPTDPEQATEIPWWLILLAVLIALIILTLIVMCCWRLGFFKRNRPHLEKAQYSKGAPSGEHNGHYADESARYAQPQMYSPERHGTKV
ncbi:integrin alpha domain-containing protein [Ditylenchus destructor]|uniref:Integrin alpha domain-containing protein n=1 Tax=Ditylenchus destructor TaxID=166010 RepID=A0AAD4NL77_9BILA|nr:integrin alpha domain-containing protein [Ditylenchus destructor]